MMKARTWIALCSFALVMLAGLPTSASAQTSFELGPRGGIGLGDFDDPFIGADLRVTTASLPVQINPSFDYYFVEGDGVSAFNIAANAIFPFGVDNQVFTPYAGGGLSITRISVDTGALGFDSSTTDTALNLLAGAAFETGSLKPFVQANVTLGGDADLLGIAGGLLFGL